MKKIFSIIFVLILIVVIGLYFLNNWYNSAIFDGTESHENIEISVAEGTTFFDVVEELEAQGVVKSKTAVQVYLRLENLSPNIKAGDYSIPGGTNIPELIEILEKGVFKPATWVTLKEGYRAEQMAERFKEELGDQFNSDTFLNIALNPSEYEFETDIETFLTAYKPEGNSLRGFLYPDTYRIDNDMTEVMIINAMLKNFKSKVDNELNFKNLTSNQENFDDFYSGLILASIIEKEASAGDDRADISSVFHNRLGIGQALQSDATVNFITGKSDAGVLISDTQIDDPYNTYIYPGLPPTPINNPRIESIVAALKPNTTSFFYFFHDDSGGQTYYSETFEEHNRKVGEIRGFN